MAKSSLRRRHRKQHRSHSMKGGYSSGSSYVTELVGNLDQQYNGTFMGNGHSNLLPALQAEENKLYTLKGGKTTRRHHKTRKTRKLRRSRKYRGGWLL